MSYQHIKMTAQDEGLILDLDFQGRSANILSLSLIEELTHLLDTLQDRPDISYLLMQSVKPSGFVFGADITEFETLSSEDEVRAHQQKAMAMLDKLEGLLCPTIAFIHGPALGGGLELALACDYRLLAKDERVMLGFPEVNLGLMPGFAGTARSTRLIGAAPTLSLCLSGKAVTSAEEALTLGLADAVAARDELLQIAQSFTAKGKRRYEQHPPLDDAHAKSELARMQANSPEGAIPHIDAIISHFLSAGSDVNALTEGELSHFPALMMGDVSSALRRVFALTDMVKKQAKGASSLSKIYVIGAGAMGADIATLCALKGRSVYLADVNEEALQAAKAKAAAYFERKLPADKAADAAARFQITAPQHMTDIDLVIEAVPEKMELKQLIWQDIEPKLRPDTIPATNTSCLDLEKIASAMQRPERLVGLHFFNPATVMPLIEVVHTDKSDAAVIDELMKLSLNLGKFPVKVRNSPGFIVNRALLPYIYEAIEVMLEGGQADEIDEAFISYGMPMGPLELADQIGLDVCLDVGLYLGIEPRVKAFLEEMLAQGRKGRKTKQGIYEWEDKSAIRPRAAYDGEARNALIERIIAPMIAACRAAVDAGDVENDGFADAAMIFGTGFPRHRGGPLFDAT